MSYYRLLLYTGRDIFSPEQTNNRTKQNSEEGRIANKLPMNFTDKLQNRVLCFRTPFRAYLTFFLLGVPVTYPSSMSKTVDNFAIFVLIIVLFVRLCAFFLFFLKKNSCSTV